MNEKYRWKKCILDIETTSFTPWIDGRIICIGIKDIDSDETIVFYDEHEEMLLVKFLQYFNKKDFREIIGFNLSFDIRFIFSRCLKYKIPSYDFFKASQFDLMMVLKGVKKGYNFNKPGTLNEWATFLFNKGKLFENTKISSLYEEGRIDEIIEYNKNDLELTYDLWGRINLVLMDVRQ